MKAEKNMYCYLASSICLVGFMIIGYLAKFYEATLKILDTPIQEMMRHSITANKTTAFIWITKFGSGMTLAFLLVLLVAFCLKNRFYTESIWMFINTALIAGLGNFLIKFLFNRPRPSIEHFVVETHSSYPSGHAMGSMLFYGGLIFLCARFIKNKTLRLGIQILLGLLILSIGLSRIYLGVHYPTDIIGGYLLGLAWLLATYPIYRKQQFILQFKGKQN